MNMPKVDRRKKYFISCEVDGEFAMYVREDSGSDITTFPYPPRSVSKGIIESILYMPSASVVPYKIEICKPIKYQPWAFNYRGPLQKQHIVRDGGTSQIKATILRDVCYKIYAYVVQSDNPKISESAKRYKNVNHPHAYQEIFNRRLRKNQNDKTPCLGWSEFLVDYIGVLRESTHPDPNINMVIPYITDFCFDKLNNGNFKPSFSQNVKIEKGVVRYV